MSPCGGLYSEGRFNGFFFRVAGLGGLYLEGLVFGIYQNMVFKFNTVAEFSPILVSFC